MAKIRLVQFEIISLLSESKRITDYLQKLGSVELDDVDDDALLKYDTSAIVSQYDKKHRTVTEAINILNRYCSIKKSLLDSFTDFKEIAYDEYKLMCDKVSSFEEICNDVINLNNKIKETHNEISDIQRVYNYHSNWQKLDIPMASKRTLSTNIFIGTFNRELNEEEIIKLINQADEELKEVAVEVISSGPLLTCAVIMCHNSCAERLDSVLKAVGFTVPEKTQPQVASKTADECQLKIKELSKKIDEYEARLRAYSDSYDNLRFLSDYYTAQKDKYETVEKTASTQSVYVLRGYMPERMAEEVKFAIEQKFTCQVEFSEPDYEIDDVPVLIENGMFAGGVESITDMYSSPSNNDIDPNPIMAFFYYVFFGFMLSDAGYGILMIIFAIVARAKFKVKGNSLKFANMVFFCGISTVFWGAMFGGWFGDLIPIIATNFLGYETGPDLAIWMDPIGNSMNLLLYCLGFGIIQLFAGLLIHGFMLIKRKEYVAAFCDTLPVIIFVSGFAIIGAGLMTELPQKISSLGVPLLAAGAVLIILTAGRSAKNILGKLGGGLYCLYTVATGYVGDILSYSRLLALSLVTGVVASAVNLLASMLGNIFAFIPIFIFGHILNIAINLIGTYVHTNRLQYVEFFSKFYEGSGRVFTPFRINSKYYTIKEEKKYE